jgi:hypothetical protein
MTEMDVEIARQIMKTTARILRAMAVTATFVLVFFASKSYGASNAFKLTSFGGGYSFVLKDVRYQESGQGYLAPRMKACLFSSFGLVTDGHMGIMLDGFVQFYDEIYHNLSDVGPSTILHDSTALLNFGVSFEYIIFRDINRSWNPYVNVGAFFSVPLNAKFNILDGFVYPNYPRKGERAGFKAAVGTRVRISRTVYLSPQVTYLSPVSVVSFQVGVDLIFPKKPGTGPVRLPPPGIIK